MGTWRCRRWNRDCRLIPIGAQNEELNLNNAIKKRLAEKPSAFDKLILRDAPPPQRGRVRTDLKTKELALLVRYGAPRALAETWLADKVAQQQEALGEPGDCMIM